MGTICVLLIGISTLTLKFCNLQLSISSQNFCGQTYVSHAYSLRYIYQLWKKGQRFLKLKSFYEKILYYTANVVILSVIILAMSRY